MEQIILEFRKGWDWRLQNAARNFPEVGAVFQIINPNQSPKYRKIPHSSFGLIDGGGGGEGGTGLKKCFGTTRSVKRICSEKRITTFRVSLSTSSIDRTRNGKYEKDKAMTQISRSG